MKAVKKTVSSLDGVDKVDIDFESRTATITMKDGKKLTEDALKKAFEGSKYGVKSFETVKAKKDESKKEEHKKEAEDSKKE